jgi:Flp pilus assembly protein protease CpaA
MKISPWLILDLFVVFVSLKICMIYYVEPIDWFVTKESYIFLGYSLSTFLFGILTLYKISKQQQKNFF